MSVRAAMDFDKVRAGAERIVETAESFGHSAGQADGLPCPEAPLPSAGQALERFLAAMAGALRVAETELTQHSSALTATVNSYQQAEEVLSHWNVPSWGA